MGIDTVTGSPRIFGAAEAQRRLFAAILLSLLLAWSRSAGSVSVDTAKPAGELIRQIEYPLRP
jgi:hypothetical protein